MKRQWYIAAACMLLAVFPTESKQHREKTEVIPSCLLTVRMEIDPVMDTLLTEGFSRSLGNALEQKFVNIKLCVDTCRSGCVQSGHGALDLSIRYEGEEDTTIYNGSIIVNFKKREGSKTDEGDGSQVLTLFQVPSGIDRGGLYMVVAEKIVENVRREVLGEVKVTTVPEGASFILDSTLGENRSPKTLLLPPATYTLEAWLPRYLPYRGEVRVSVPGITEVHIKLTKRRFYHSRYMPLFYVLSTATISAFAAEWYFYKEYSKLGENDFFNRPREFEKRFNRAQRFEYAAVSLLGLTGVCFAVTFFF
ncbi:MAG: PEGA domain-containing protein [Chitinispirillaceae bacterium]|nr:PEGA domain-containing protein [Chitinispirillaceae bacterium]